MSHCPPAGRAIAALLLASTSASAASAVSGKHDIHLVRGHLYGPGPLPDQEFKPGSLNSLRLVSFLKGEIPLLNNGGAGPNLEAESFHGHKPDGRLCDGTPINENVDVGNVTLMGQLQLLLGAVGAGPNGGRVNFYLDDRINWTILDDIAIDPGFVNGLIKIENFTWSTSPRRLPLSLQSQRGYPGAVDRAGSKTSGSVLMGRLGDDDLDGNLDGVFNAIGNFPLTSAFLPGAPFAQTRDFKTDISILPLQAALLTFAGARNELNVAADPAEPRIPQAEVDELRRDAASRVHLARIHLERARDDATLDAVGGRAALGDLLARADRLERSLAGAPQVWPEIASELDEMVAALAPAMGGKR
ncbi:MAG TPA: hypothetical protein VI356_21335 [Myxococcales bacterium]